ncbi:MAG: metallophosphoesterase [Bacillota bacterium]
MAIFAIGDIHLSHGQDKPMNIFGSEWESHIEKISNNWQETVGKDDLVIVAGDISWAMHLSDAAEDLLWLAEQPGTKLLIKGNHDYWWNSIGKVRAVLPRGIYALQNDHFLWDDCIVCGTRGWICPGEEGFDNEQDQKLYLREVQRLELSLNSASSKPSENIIAALHFPPFNRKNQPSAFTELLENYSVNICVFGHIHDSGRDYIFQGVRNGVEYRFVAADGLGFTPLRIV